MWHQNCRLLLLCRQMENLEPATDLFTQIGLKTFQIFYFYPLNILCVQDPSVKRIWYLTNSYFPWLCSKILIFHRLWTILLPAWTQNKSKSCHGYLCYSNLVILWKWVLKLDQLTLKSFWCWPTLKNSMFHLKQRWKINEMQKCSHYLIQGCHIILLLLPNLGSSYLTRFLLITKLILLGVQFWYNQPKKYLVNAYQIKTS